VGRIAAFIDYTYKEAGSGKIGWFGLFESEEDMDTARLLIDKAIEYLKENGCKKVIGPAKFNASGYQYGYHKSHIQARKDITYLAGLWS